MTIERPESLIEKLLTSAGGGADMLHIITNPSTCRSGGASDGTCSFEDAQSLKRANTLEQASEDQPWGNNDFQNQEEALLSMKAEELKRAASSDMASTGVGADGFHPQSFTRLWPRTL